MNDRTAQEAPTTPRPSSTVVLVRDADDGPEVLLVLRHADTAFGASYVFPGGTLDPADYEAAALCAGLEPAAANALLGCHSDALAYYSAAVRELFEETGVLLAKNGDGMLPADSAAFAAARAAVHAGRRDWCEFLRDARLQVACEQLCYFAFWVTPRVFSRRFSTRFFIARLPAGQSAEHDGSELTDSCWLRPAAALAAASAGELSLPPPTRMTLAALAPLTTLDAIDEWALAEQQRGIRCLLPAVVDEDGQRRILLPGDAAYPASHEGCEA